MVCMQQRNQPNWLVLCGVFQLHAGDKGQQPPAAVQAEVRQGIDALERSNFSAAEEHLSRALEADPNLSEARANLGLAYYADHKYAQAVQSFQLALKQNSSLQVPQTFLPLSLAALNRCEDAIPGLRREFSANPDVKLRRVIGLGFERCLFERGEQAEADQVTQKLLAQYPDDVDVLYEAGQAYRKHGEGEQSIAAFRRALRANPDFVEARVALAKAYRQQGKKEEAVSALEPARQAAPENAAVRFLLVQLYRDLGRSADAER